MDKIIIKSARFLCNIGVSSEERRKKQKISVDVELYTKKLAKPIFLSDDIKDTVNYSEVYDLLKEIVEKNECKLIETMAQKIAVNILSKFSVEKVLVNVKKSKLKNKNIRYVAIEILRKKNG